MQNCKKIILVVFFAVIIPALMFQFVIRKKAAPKIPIDKTALFDVNGSKVTLSNNIGKVMIVSYFQSWCGDCRKEHW